MKDNITIVFPNSSESLKQRVFRIRYQVYIDEMRLPLPVTSKGLLHDDFDSKSINLLYSKGNQDIGTMRITFLKDGNLEIMQQSPRWRHIVSTKFKDANSVCEFNRFIVKASGRGSAAASAHLMYTAFTYCTSVNAYNVLAAGKVGRLTSYYKKIFGSIIDNELVHYVLDGHSLGQYRLMYFNFGMPHSFRRCTISATYSILNYFCCNHWTLFKSLFQRGQGFKKK